MKPLSGVLHVKWWKKLVTILSISLTKKISSKLNWPVKLTGYISAVASPYQPNSKQKLETRSAGLNGFLYKICQLIKRIFPVKKSWECPRIIFLWLRRLQCRLNHGFKDSHNAEKLTGNFSLESWRLSFI